MDGGEGGYVDEIILWEGGREQKKTQKKQVKTRPNTSKQGQQGVPLLALLALENCGNIYISGYILGIFNIFRPIAKVGPIDKGWTR